MERYKELKEMINTELKRIQSKGELTAASLAQVETLAHTLKCLSSVEKDEEKKEGGYSEGYYPERYAERYAEHYPYPPMYYEEGGYSSYARGRGRGARRDSRGRYSSEGGSSSYEGGSSSYEGGRSSYEDGGAQSTDAYGRRY